ncbi:hypothetical protein ACOMHN_037919 [Nucella lapillus]
MNSEGEYTLCNLDTHSYANSFNGPDLSNTIFANHPGATAASHPGYHHHHHHHHQSLGHATPSPHRSLDTRQAGYPLHYSATASAAGPPHPHNEGLGPNAADLPLATTPQSLGGYPLHTSALRAAATRQHVPTTSPYGHLPDLGLSQAGDCYMNGASHSNGNLGHHNGQNMCMDISAGMRPGAYPCHPDGVRGVSTPNSSAYLHTVTSSPIKTEGGGGVSGGGMQSLHNKPFRWMTIKRNGPKPDSIQGLTHRGGPEGLTHRGGPEGLTHRGGPEGLTHRGGPEGLTHRGGPEGLTHRGGPEGLTHRGGPEGLTHRGGPEGLTHRGGPDVPLPCSPPDAILTSDVTAWLVC